MRLSHFIYALTLIAYAALQLGASFYDKRLVWWGVIVATIVWIVESLASDTPLIRLPRFQRAQPDQG